MSLAPEISIFAQTNGDYGDDDDENEGGSGSDYGNGGDNGDGDDYEGNSKDYCFRNTGCI